MKKSGLAVIFGTFAVAFLATGCISFPDNESPTPPFIDGGSHTSVHHDGAEQELYPLESNSLKLEVDKEFEARHPGFMGWFSVYWKDRLLDLQDIVSADLAVGRGFLVNVRPTEYAQAGIGWYDGSKLGWRQRASGWWDESRVERGLSAFYWLEVDRRARWGTKTLHAQNYDYTGWDIWEDHTEKTRERDWADLGASVVIAFVGADVNVSPVELVDAVAGWLPTSLIWNILGYHAPVFDVSEDDTWSALRDELIQDRGIED